VAGWVPGVAGITDDLVCLPALGTGEAASEEISPRWRAPQSPR